MLVVQSRHLLIHFLDKTVEICWKNDTAVKRGLVQCEIGIDENEIGLDGDFNSETIKELSQE